MRKKGRCIAQKMHGFITPHLVHKLLVLQAVLTVLYYLLCLAKLRLIYFTNKQTLGQISLAKLHHLSSYSPRLVEGQVQAVTGRPTTTQCSSLLAVYRCTHLLLPVLLVPVVSTLLKENSWMLNKAVSFVCRACPESKSFKIMVWSTTALKTFITWSISILESPFSVHWGRRSHSKTVEKHWPPWAHYKTLENGFGTTIFGCLPMWHGITLKWRKAVVFATLHSTTSFGLCPWLLVLFSYGSWWKTWSSGPWGGS